MAVGADKRIWDRDGSQLVLSHEHAFGEKLEIYLVHDSDIWRHAAEVIEGPLTPPQKLVSFPIPLEFHFDILFQRVRRTKEVNLHRMVDDQIDGNERIDLPGISSQTFH